MSLCYVKVQNLLSTDAGWLKQKLYFAKQSNKSHRFLTLCVFAPSSPLRGIPSPKEFISDINNASLTLK